MILNFKSCIRFPKNEVNFLFLGHFKVISLVLNRVDDLKIFLFCNVCTEKDLSFCQKLRFSNRFFAILLYQSSKYQRFLPEGGKILGIEHLSLWQILNFFTSLDLHAEVLMQGKLYQRCTHLLYCSRSLTWDSSFT